MLQRIMDLLDKLVHTEVYSQFEEDYHLRKGDCPLDGDPHDIFCINWMVKKNVW